MKCVVCGHETESYLERCQDHIANVNPDRLFSLECCRNCGTGYSVPFLTVEELNPYYSSNYDPYTQNKSVFFKLMTFIKAREIKKLRKLVASPHPYLFDIGAGSGVTLGLAQKAGFEVAGSDLNNPNIISNIKKKYNIDLIACDAENLKFTQKYDVVNLRYVLEHLNNPRSVIENVYCHALNEGGILFIIIPRMDSLDVQSLGHYSYCVDAPRHRTLFSKKSIQYLLKDIGFSKVKISCTANLYDYARGYFRVRRAQKKGKKVLYTLAAPYYLLLALISCFYRPSTMKITAIK